MNTGQPVRSRRRRTEDDERAAEHDRNGAAPDGPGPPPAPPPSRPVLTHDAIVAPTPGRGRIARPARRRSRGRTTVPAVRKALIGLAVSVADVVMLAAPAGAHATLIQTQPAASQVYSSPPPAIVLRFSESVQVKLGGIRLFDAKGHRIDTGAPSHPNGAGATVSVSLPKLKDGTYVATWRVISADGHPVQNGFTFSVGEVSATGANAQSLANRLLSQQGGSRVVGVINGALRFVEFAATGLLLGARSAAACR